MNLKPSTLHTAYTKLTRNLHETYSQFGTSPASRLIPNKEPPQHLACAEHADIAVKVVHSRNPRCCMKSTGCLACF